jgi:hypothetical protein
VDHTHVVRLVGGDPGGLVQHLTPGREADIGEQVPPAVDLFGGLGDRAGEEVAQQGDPVGEGHRAGHEFQDEELMRVRGVGTFGADGLADLVDAGVDSRDPAQVVPPAVPQVPAVGSPGGEGGPLVDGGALAGSVQDRHGGFPEVGAAQETAQPPQQVRLEPDERSLLGREGRGR